MAQLIAHRGCSSDAPENTLSAFEAALDLGVDAIELDVHATKDGEIVVMHDSFVGRTTNGVGRISTMALEKIKSLDAGSWFSKQFCGERVPTLDEVLELVGRRAGLFIELKAPGLEKRALQLVKGRGLLKNATFTSFNNSWLKKLKQAEPKARIGDIILLNVFAPWGEYADYDMVLPFWPIVGESFIEEAHKKKLGVAVWTVNSAELIDYFTGYGVDGVITDYPRAAKGAKR